ncbi:MAG: T9SS type A sorting domain-containing protein [Bacteroidota bacterium]|nr:T9SS type A sorting domain-containing protein [Bacteroidota bacterium]
MKKILLFAFVTLFSISNTFAQLPDGSVAPNFDLTDLNGTSHDLYALLDQGYTVFLDFSAVWCPPCWSYHTGGTLEDLYENHGPAGYPGVSANTTDDVMVFMIEGDENTVANLGGTGGNTQGDWITGTLYPIICTDGTVNNDNVTSDYQIGYWPTIYMVCPDRLTTEVGQSSNPYGSISGCPPPASNDNDARTFDYTGETLTCEGDLVPEIMIQNYGLLPLTSLTIEVSVNGTVVSTTPWSGNLATYGTDNIALPALTGLAGNDAVTINTTSPNGVVDADPTNNPTISFNVVMATQNANAFVTVEIVTDAYGSETTWDVKDANGMTILSGGPYNDLGAAGTTTQTPVSGTLALNTCHTFTIYDTYGDGIDAGYGAGSFTVTDGNGTILASGGQFTDIDGDAFKTGNSGSAPDSWDCDPILGCTDPGTGNGQYTTLASCQAVCGTTDITENSSSLAIYPSPVKDVLTIEGAYIAVDIFDIFGKLVLSSEYTKNINVSSLANGIYMLNITTDKEIRTQKITITK